MPQSLKQKKYADLETKCLVLSFANGTILSTFLFLLRQNYDFFLNTRFNHRRKTVFKACTEPLYDLFSSITQPVASKTLALLIATVKRNFFIFSLFPLLQDVFYTACVSKGVKELSLIIGDCFRL